MKLIWLAHVWPEPRSSAAGTRTMQLAESFRTADWEVVFASACRPNEALTELRSQGWRVEAVALNDSAFDRWIEEERPSGVIFDRFMVEEQFGWRVERAVPGALRILDTIDLHFLRNAREASVGEATMRGAVPGVSPWTEDALRELAAIHRSDLTWVVSDFEARWLREHAGVLPEQVQTLRFGPGSFPLAAPPAFSEREGFAFIGNFRHPPNPDALEWFRQAIWPRVRERLPGTVMRVYGAYPPRAWMERDDASVGFRVLGPAADSVEALSRARVVVAPLRYGAGIKGKILDAWSSGAPVVATPVAAEGMSAGLPWGGVVADSAGSFADACVLLHESERDWALGRSRGRDLLLRLFDPERIGHEAIEGIELACSELSYRRERNLTGALLRYHGARSTEYFSRWIELKNSR